VEAFRCHTEHAAATLGLSERIGHLRVGADADLIVVDTDPFKAEAAAVRGTRVLRHFRAGDEVWRRSPED
jgi:predicted amidohydrolase YtcJ